MGKTTVRSKCKERGKGRRARGMRGIKRQVRGRGRRVKRERIMGEGQEVTKDTRLKVYRPTGLRQGRAR